MTAAGETWLAGQTYPKRILAVDDDAILLEFARTELAAGGATVATASDGEAGLVALARGEPAEVVVLDMEMPKVDGLAFLRALPRLGLARAPAVVMLTSRSDAATMAKAFELGAVAYALKPVDWPALRSKVARAFQTPAM